MDTGNYVLIIHSGMSLADLSGFRPNATYQVFNIHHLIGIANISMLRSYNGF